MAYLLDANTFIEAKNGYYHFEVCPGFWDWILAGKEAGRVFSIARVGQELNAGTDALSQWAVKEAAGLFLAADEGTVLEMKKVVNWVMSQPYDEKNRAGFFSKADPLLIAHALAHGHTVITHETKVNAESRKVKVPNVCDALGVRWMHSFKMLQEEKARFILSA
ncbi:MAG: DUF4411 family protein [Verrucomicrobiota bacterium]